MHMLTARGFFAGLPSEDPHAHIAKLRSLWKSCVGRLDMDNNIIGLRVFPLSLTRDVVICFIKIPFILIYTWYQLRDVFLKRYYPVSIKVNHKYKVINFVAILGESVSSSGNKFTVFVRSIPNHHIDDDLLKEYFKRGQDDNNKAVLDTIAGGSYGECTSTEIAQNLEKIFHKNKAWSTSK